MTKDTHKENGKDKERGRFPKRKCSRPDTRRDQTGALHSLLCLLFIRGRTHLRAAAPDQLWRVTFNVKLATWNKQGELFYVDTFINGRQV